MLALNRAGIRLRGADQACAPRSALFGMHGNFSMSKKSMPTELDKGVSPMQSDLVGHCCRRRYLLAPVIRSSAIYELKLCC
jgi:hypothetical protein